MSRKDAFMGFLFLCTLFVAIVLGYFLCGCSSFLLLMVSCFLLSLISMVVGMVLAFMHRRETISIPETKASLEEKIKEAIKKDREIYGAMSVEMAKAVADRVANKIVSKHVVGMNDDGVRQAILNSVNTIVEEEIGILHEAMKHEAEI